MERELPIDREKLSCLEILRSLYRNLAIQCFFSLFLLAAYVPAGGILFSWLEHKAEIEVLNTAQERKLALVDVVAKKLSGHLFNSTENRLMIYLDPERSQIVHKLMAGLLANDTLWGGLTDKFQIDKVGWNRPNAILRAAYFTTLNFETDTTVFRTDTGRTVLLFYAPVGFVLQAIPTLLLVIRLLSRTIGTRGQRDTLSTWKLIGVCLLTALLWPVCLTVISLIGWYSTQGRVDAPSLTQTMRLAYQIWLSLPASTDHITIDPSNKTKIAIVALASFPLHLFLVSGFTLSLLLACLSSGRASSKCEQGEGKIGVWNGSSVKNPMETAVQMLDSGGETRVETTTVAESDGATAHTPLLHRPREVLARQSRLLLSIANRVIPNSPRFTRAKSIADNASF